MTAVAEDAVVVAVESAAEDDEVGEGRKSWRYSIAAKPNSSSLELDY